jgi:molybdate transport system substrate-binding protein
VLVAFLLVAGCLAAGPPRAAKAQNAEILISAAISLKEAFNEIGGLYERRTGSPVTFSFGSSGELEKQIEAGAPVDVFASAGEREMDRLETKNLIESSSRQDFARNILVVVVPADSRLRLRSVTDLAKADVKKIALGDPKTVPAGAYASEMLNKAQLRPVLDSRLIFAENVRQVLDYVMRGEVDAGIVYATDVPVAGGRVAVAARVPAGDYDPILYPIAVVKGSPHARAAAEFVNLVLGPEGIAILKKHGFLAVK